MLPEIKGKGRAKGILYQARIKNLEEEVDEEQLPKAPKPQQYKYMSRPLRAKKSSKGPPLPSGLKSSDSSSRIIMQEGRSSENRDRDRERDNSRDNNHNNNHNHNNIQNTQNKHNNNNKHNNSNKSEDAHGSSGHEKVNMNSVNAPRSKQNEAIINNREEREPVFPIEESMLIQQARGGELRGDGRRHHGVIHHSNILDIYIYIYIYI